MNFRLTAVLFAVVLTLVVGLLVYALFFAADPAAPADGPFATLTAANVKAADVTVVEIARTSPRDDKLVFTRADGKWRLTAPADAGVDSDAIDRLVGDLLALKAKEMTGSVDRSTTGLSKPEVTLTLKAGDKSASVHVGNTTFANDEKAVTFLVSATDPDIRPMAVLTSKLRNGLFRPDAKEGTAASLVKWRTDFRPRALLPGDARDAEADTSAVTITQGEKRLALARTGGEWRFTQPPLGLADVNGASEPDPTRFTGVRPLLNALLLLRTNGSEDVIEDVPAAELPKYGLADAPESLRVQFTPKDRGTQTLFVGKRLADKDKDGKPLPSRYYVKLSGDAAVFTVSTSAVDTLVNTLNDPTSLQNRDLLPPAKVALLDAVDSSFGGGFQLRKLAGTGEVWGVYGGGGEPAEAQPQAVQNLLSRLAAPRVAADVLSQPDDTAFDATNLQAVLKVWAGGVNKDKAKLADGKLPPEPPVGGEPTVTLRIGRSFVKKVNRPDGTAEDRKLVVVRRTVGKDSTDLEVPLDAVALALQPRIKFVSASVPSFVPSQATGLVLFRDAARSEFVKNAAADPAYRFGVWNLGDVKGPVADGDTLLELLSRLASAATSLVMEKADDLKAHGLDPANPKLSATVTLPGEKGGTRTLAYHFGEPVKGDDKSVYFKTVDKPFVYAVPADLYNRLRTADLKDKVAFRLDTTKVKKVTMRGWAATTADKSQVKLAVELQTGAWVATDPKGAAFDAAAVAEWLNALRFPKSVGPAPVEPGKDPPAAYGLGFDGVNLLIISSGAKPGDPDTGFDITLGALSEDKRGVYARLSDGRVFLLDAQPFGLLLARSPLAGK